MDPATDRKIGRAALLLTGLVIVILSATAAIALWPARAIELKREWYADANYTLIVFGRESCAACSASAGFHKTLVAACEGRGVKVVAALTSRGEEPAAFAGALGLTTDHAVLANPPPKHLDTIPAIVIVNRRGEVLQQKQGALSSEDQRALLKFVENLR